MKLKSLALSIALLSNAALADQVLSCDGCASDSQYQAKAVNYHLNKYGRNEGKRETYQLINAERGIVKAVHVLTVYEPESRRVNVFKTMTATDHVIEDKVVELRTLISRSGQSGEDGNMPSWIADDVFEALHDTRVESKISDRIALSNDWEYVMARFGVGFTLPLQIFNRLLKFAPTMTIVFENGSSMEFEFSGVTRDMLTEWTYKLGTAKDSEGIKIPENANEAKNKDYYFDLNSHEDRVRFQAWAAHIKGFGMQFSGGYNGSVPPSGSVTIVPCPKTCSGEPGDG